VIHRGVIKEVMKKEEFCIVALVNRVGGGDEDAEVAEVDKSNFSFGFS
jgi:hypothetical protein